MIFFGKAKDLQFLQSNQKAWLDFLVMNDGKELYMKVDKVKGVRSLPQNSLYWHYLEVIANDTGNNAEDMHKLFKGLFLPKREIKVKGKSYMMSGSTTGLDKAGMGEYMNKIAGYVEIPVPDPQLVAIDRAPEYPVNNLEPKF